MTEIKKPTKISAAINDTKARLQHIQREINTANPVVYDSQNIPSKEVF